MPSLAYNVPPAETSAADSFDIEVESSRYALLRRLAPALRHNMVGEFQPISMISAMMERRLQASPLNVDVLRDNCVSIGNLARSAANSCINLMTWLSPRSAMTLTADAAVAECLSLLATEFRFRGFVLVNHVKGCEAYVSASALRPVLTSALITLTDLEVGPGDLHVSAQLAPHGVRFTITRQGAERQADNASLSDYRLLGWRDVRALARGESVTLEPVDSGVVLEVPQVAPPKEGA